MQDLNPFKLERFLAEHEFRARYFLSPSDCESLSQRELLALSDDECRALWENLTLGYTESQGHPVLRAEIARLYPALSAESILVLTPEEGIFIAMLSLLRPGDRVVAIAPAYQSLHEIARGIGCEVALWPMVESEAGWEADIDHLARLLAPRTRLLIINFPHNPTGYLPRREVLDAVLPLARKHDLCVFSDEMYRGLEYSSSQRLPAVAEIFERGVSLSGLSKTQGLAGLRIGWLATQSRDLMAQWLKLKDYTTICHSAPSEVLALMALRAGKRITARNLAIIQSNIVHATLFFSRHPALFSWVPPRAGSTAFPRWVGPEPVEEFCHHALESQDVLVVPGSMFDMPGRHFRIGLGRRSFPDALEVLGRVLESRGRHAGDESFRTFDGGESHESR
ncbi:MAG: aminotransferase class I/II-fold pyridoxal phosphate-dependent enzyme [Acidobacteriota bacterium]